ncbi:MAG: hypothetical protein IE922_04080 [Sphingomonadales bacterium]|nr:hypothetical protein [Sphingomonadales bacterium]
MRVLPIAALLLSLPLSLAAQEAPAPAIGADPLSAEIGAQGIRPVLARLSALPAPTPQERFAMGGLEFLAGIEGMAQTLAQVAMPNELDMVMGPLPRSRPAPGEVPRRLAPGDITALAQGVSAAMARSEAALQGLAEGPEFGLALDPDDLWFDLDGDGQRGPQEAARPMLAQMLMGRRAPQDTGPAPVIRFDNADAAWLSAYTHMLSGTAEMVQAFDPEPPIARTLATLERIAAARTAEGQGITRDLGLDGFIDPMATLLDILAQQPDPAHTRAARDHWRAMLAQNRLFWRRVATETDNRAEFIPNDAQQSVLPIAFPQGLGASWQDVLADAEALLEGRATIPFWRAPIGIDLGAWLQDPAPLPLTGVIQGWALAPYFSEAPRVSPESWRQFEAMLDGRATLMTVITLN